MLSNRVIKRNSINRLLAGESVGSDALGAAYESVISLGISSRDSDLSNAIGQYVIDSEDGISDVKEILVGNGIAMDSVNRIVSGSAVGQVSLDKAYEALKEKGIVPNP